MPARLKVELMLKSSHWPELRRVVARPGTTVGSLHQWLRLKGYRISRNACWNFIKKQRPSAGVNFASAADARRQAKPSLDRLDGQILIMFASLAVIAASASSKKGMFEGR